MHQNFVRKHQVFSKIDYKIFQYVIWDPTEKAIKKAEDYYTIAFEKENVYVIGDTPRDIECGKILKIKSVAVATGGYSYNDLLKYDPDYIFNNFEVFEEFLDIL